MGKDLARTICSEGQESSDAIQHDLGTNCSAQKVNKGIIVHIKPFLKLYFRYSIFVLQISCLRLSYSLSIQYLAAIKAESWAEYPPFSLSKKGTLGLLHNSWKSRRKKNSKKMLCLWFQERVAWGFLGVAFWILREFLSTVLARQADLKTSAE